jgi:hypothetical protein
VDEIWSYIKKAKEYHKRRSWRLWRCLYINSN